MIQLPKRSVTRFFIPLIDVLTLLFCIFLVMPMAQNNEESLRKQLEEKEAELARLNKTGGDTEALQKVVEDLRRQLRLADRFPPTRVLEIDPATGGLLNRDDRDNKKPINNRAAAQDLIAADRRELNASKGQIYYLILFPRDRKSEHPLNSELDAYADWLEGVKLKYDIPGKGLIQGP